MFLFRATPLHSIVHPHLHASGLHAATAAIAAAAGDIDGPPLCRLLDEFGEERHETERGLPRGLRHARQHRPRRERAVEARLEERHVARGTHADVVKTVITPGSYHTMDGRIIDFKFDRKLNLVISVIF